MSGDGGGGDEDVKTEGKEEHGSMGTARASDAIGAASPVAGDTVAAAPAEREAKAEAREGGTDGIVMGGDLRSDHD